MKFVPLLVPVALLCLVPRLQSQPVVSCPTQGWQENLGYYLQADKAFPSTDTAGTSTPDCVFHEWAWEGFVWATALLTDQHTTRTAPRFMFLPTPADLFSPLKDAGEFRLRPLKLAARSRVFRGEAGFSEGAGVIVEADGHMLVAPNGYPVYASVHMNKLYFDKAKKNLIADGGYKNSPRDDFFEVGSAVFKATWLRLAAGQSPPTGAFTTQAEVPVLQTQYVGGKVVISPVPGQTVTATVALVGLHVVGYTTNHPEFLWATFEHNLNSPQVPDNTYPGLGSSPNSYTFYSANTPFSQANLVVAPPNLTLNAATQQFTPTTTVVLENQTGAEDQPNGPQNIAMISGQAQAILKASSPQQSVFANYNLIGTVWMDHNTYNLKSNQQNAVGSINLANSTAETFAQTPTVTARPLTNCFLCHNPTSYTFQTPPPAKLPTRLIALSHVLAENSAYAVPNEISVAELDRALDRERETKP